MRFLAAASAAGAVWLLLPTRRRVRLVDRVASYLTGGSERGSPPAVVPRAPLADAGIGWSTSEIRLRRALTAAVGAIVGMLVAQGDLFLAGSGRSTPALAVLGAAAGVLGFSVFVTQRTEKRRRQLRAELPVVADLVALRVFAGDGVSAAVEHVVDRTSGICADEFGSVLDVHRGGVGLSEALLSMARRSEVPEAARLYGFLANAHVSGGRLAEALVSLAADLRAQEERAIRTEGGKRALAVYAPILALMIPVALIFLMYPTLVGLSDFSAVP